MRRLHITFVFQANAKKDEIIFAGLPSQFALARSNIRTRPVFFVWHSNKNDIDIPSFTNTQLPLFFILFLSSAKTTNWP